MTRALNKQLPMLPINASPTRMMYVSDPGKLSYFARANMTRAGLRGNLAAAVSGGAGIRGLDGFGETVQDVGTSSDARNSTGGQTVADFFTRLGSSLLGGGAAPAPVLLPAPAPSPVPMIIGGVAVLGVGFLAWKMLKKAR